MLLADGSSRETLTTIARRSLILGARAVPFGQSAFGQTATGNITLAETLREPAIKSRIEGMQITMQIGGPDVQRKFLANQMNLWGPVVKEQSIKADS
jgi:hypothetical protein